MTRENIIEAVRQAGIIGAGGGGFPTYIKLQSNIDTLIANGSECEPLLNSDKTLLKEKTPLIIEGIHHTMNATGAKNAYIAVKAIYKDVISTLQNELAKDPDNNSKIHIHPLENYYPAGDEFLTVYDVTGQVIPEGGLPLHVGVLVSNVLTLSQIAQATSGKPVTERPITITGSVKNPQVLTIPIGTPYKKVIEIAGGTLNPDDIILDGGPMMGNIVNDLNNGIAKTTSGIIALPADHFIITMKQLTPSQIVKRSKTACCQCFRCTDFCPRNLLGHAIHPHKTMRTIDYNHSQPTENITSAFLCSQCGMCELFACDIMKISPRKIYAEIKKQLASRGIKNPHTRTNLSPLPEIQYRKVPIPTLLKKLDLSTYAKHTPYTGMHDVQEVRIMLKKHTGTPATPTVRHGEKVKRGQIIAASPHDKIGTIIHASIPGKISEINDEYIEIKG